MSTKEQFKVTERSYDIMAGPNKDSLFDACKYACNDNVKIGIGFSIAIGYTMPIGNPGRAEIRTQVYDIKLIGIEHKDGSGESFNLHGYCSVSFESFNPIKEYHGKFKAWYNSKTRKGHITLFA